MNVKYVGTKLFLGIVLLAIFCSACRQPGTRAVQLVDQPLTITFYKRGYVPGSTDATTQTIDQAVAAFEKRFPDIHVAVVGVPWTPDGTALLDAALASRSGIDVFSVNANDLARYVRLGYLSAIDSYLTPADRQDFYASGLQAAALEDKIYAWPLWVTTVSIFANPGIFAERGVALPTLEDPWTWNEFVAAAQQLTFITQEGREVYGFSGASIPGVTVYYPLMYIDGGRVLTPDGRHFIQNAPESISALQKIAALCLVHHATAPDFGQVDQTQVLKQFKEGRLAMAMATPAFLADLEKEAVTFAVLPPPTGDTGQVVTTGGFGMYGVADSGDAARLKAAHEFARYLTGSQVAQDVAGYQLAPGLRRSNTAYATTPERDIIARLVSFGLYEAPVSLSPDLRTAWESALQAIVLGQKTPQQAMDEIAPLYQQELDQQFK